MRPELVEVPERVETERLILRWYGADDAAGIWDALQESRTYLRASSSILV